MVRLKNEEWIFTHIELSFIVVSSFICFYFFSCFKETNSKAINVVFETKMPLSNWFDLVILLHLDQSFRNKLWNKLDDLINCELRIPFFLNNFIKNISLVINSWCTKLCFANNLWSLKRKLICKSNFEVEFVNFFA